MTFNLNLIAPAPGQQIRLHGKTYTFGLPLPDGRHSLSDLATSESLILSPQQLSQKYLEGFVEQVEEPVTADFQKRKRLGRLDFTTASDEEKATARRKQAYVQALDELGVVTHQPFLYCQIIDEVAEKLKDPCKPTHWTLQRWRRDWHWSGQDPRVFLPRTKCRGNRRLRWTQEQFAIAGEVAKRGLLTAEQHSVSKFCRSLEAAIFEANKLREPEHQIPIPGDTSVRRYVARLDPHGVLGARKGRRAAERAIKAYVRGVKTSRPLERVEVDHTMLDLFVIDPETGLIWGRPWLTIVIDVHTRAVLAFYLSFDPPSWITVMEAMRLAILPKGDLKKRFPDLQSTWDCHGRIEQLITDNGKEFLSTSLADAADALGIVIQHCPPHEPWFKGVVERFMRTLNQGLIHTLPGTTFGKQYRLADYDPTKHATVAFDDLVRLLHLWVIDVYMQDYHSTIKTTPAAKWAEEAAKFPPCSAPNRRELEVALGVPLERTIQHYGIEVEGQLFHSEELAGLRLRLDGPKLTNNRRVRARVKVKQLPGDISGIYVRDPLDEQYLWVSNTDQDYAKGKGWHQHRVIQEYAKTIGTGKVDREALRRAETKIARHVQQSIQRPGSKRSHKHVARYQQMAQNRHESAGAENGIEAQAGDVPPTHDDRQDDIAPLDDVALTPKAMPPSSDDWAVEVD